MSNIEVSWDDEAKTIVRYDFDFGWTWEELEIANKEFNILMKSVPHTVCAIACQNYSQHYLPPNPVARIGALLALKTEQKALSVIVARSSLVRSTLDIVMKIYPAAINLRVVNTLDEARLLIRQYWAQK